jgi:hypothetical protein
MKIKADFVTNSSSTSYTIQSVTTGHIEPLGNLKKLENLAKKFNSKYNFIDDDCAHFQYTKGNAELKNDHHNISVSLSNKRIWGNITTTPTMRNITVLHISVDNYHDWHYDTLELTKEVIEEVFRFLDLKSNSNLNYVAFPISFKGDGWDGGDSSCGPQSKYEWVKDVYENESRMGVLTIIDNRVIPYVLPLKENRSFMEETAKFINSQGVCL